MLHWEQHTGERAAEKLSLHRSLISFIHQVSAIRISTMKGLHEAAYWKAALLPTILHSIQPDPAAVLGLLPSPPSFLSSSHPPLFLPLFPLQGSSVFHWFLISSVFPHLFWQQQSDINQMVELAACFQFTIVFIPGPALMFVCGPSVDKQVEKRDG